jgi:hypothetical protein
MELDWIFDDRYRYNLARLNWIGRLSGLINQKLRILCSRITIYFFPEILISQLVKWYIIFCMSDQKHRAAITLPTAKNL